MKPVAIYEGNVPKSGKTIIEFAGIKLAHLSKVLDKSDYLVHISTQAIIRAYPIKTERAKVLDDIASNIDTLKHYVNNPKSYELYSRKEMLAEEKKEIVDDSYRMPPMTHYSDGSCVMPRVNVKPKRKFDIRGREC